jgi:hypothetical protein
MLPGTFKDFVHYFTTKRNYVRNQSISAASYDFRYSPRSNLEWMRKTKALVEELYVKNNNTKVIVVS